jgi:serine/threonine protein kinase
MQNEMQSLNRIAHPSVVRLIHSNEGGVYTRRNGQGSYTCMYMVVDLCPNGELFDVLFKTGAFSEPVARFYFKQIISGLEACHNIGIAHRDMKPENILFDAEFNLKIADFGFSILIMGRDGSGLLHTRLGTESYMAPELHMRRPYTGESVDLFAAGIILFIMISQNPPFSRAEPTDPYYRLLSSGDSRFWTAHSRNKQPNLYSADFQDYIKRMLELDPAKRLNIQQIKAHPWYNGVTASPAEVQAEISARKTRMDQIAQRATAQRTPNTRVAYNGGRYYRGESNESEGLTLSFGLPNNEHDVRTISDKELQLNKFTLVKCGLTPIDIMLIVSNELGKIDAECERVQNTYDTRVNVVTETDSFTFKTSILKTSDNFNILSFKLVEGSNFEMFKIIENITEKLIEAQESN